jgi:hypothetical protein
MSKIIFPHTSGSNVATPSTGVSYLYTDHNTLNGNGRLAMKDPDGTTQYFSSTGNQVLFVKRTLTANEILNLSSTPIELVANPGSGSFIQPHSIVTYLKFNTTPFNHIISSINYYAGSFGVDVAASAILALTESIGLIDDVSGYIYENQPLLIGSAATGSAGDSEIVVNIAYSVGTI